MIKQVHLIISGDVQGVGFRAWTKHQARKLELVGWVKNREDKTVEVVAEGEKEVLEELIKRCQHGPEVAWVSRVDVAWQQGSGEFVGFEVLY
jgi:acylphosphatase